ncbi:MAG: type II toxin-antitoxin system RelB/DinJ family antitoxin [Bilifractor sp.]|jgi:DNA-damage-inducible protein J
METEEKVFVEAVVSEELRERAEEILFELGFTPSAAITQFYQQIVFHNGLPFELRLP